MKSVRFSGILKFNQIVQHEIVRYRIEEGLLDNCPFPTEEIITFNKIQRLKKYVDDVREMIICENWHFFVIPYIKA